VRSLFIVAACVLSGTLAFVLVGAVYLLGVKHYHYTAVRPIFHFAFVRAYLFDGKFRQLVELMDEEESLQDDVFATVWDTSEGVLLSRKMFHEVEMYGAHKYMYNPGLRKLSFTIDVDGYSRFFAMVDSPALRRATLALDATHIYQATYDEFGFRRVDAELTRDCSVRVMFLGDSFTDGVYMDDRDTFVNRYGHLARERGHVAACPIDTGVDGYGSLEEAYVLEHYFAPAGRPRVAVIMHFPNDVDVDENKVIDGTMEDPSRQWADDLSYLRRMTAFARQRGVTVVLAAIPLARQSANPSTRRNYQDILRNFCEQEQIAFVDLLDPLSRFDVDDVYVKGDVHWTAKGHEVVADVLYERTKDLLAAAASGVPRP
jgi:hypothetical protein